MPISGLFLIMYFMHMFFLFTKAGDPLGDFIRRWPRSAISPSVPGAAIAIFADRRDRRIKSPISDMSDIGD